MLCSCCAGGGKQLLHTVEGDHAVAYKHATMVNALMRYACGWQAMACE